MIQINFVENIKTHIPVEYLFSPENRAVKWKNILQPDRPQMTVWRMRIACCIFKATNTHSEYVILIAFQMQQWLHERASVSRYTYIDCIVILLFTALSYFVILRRMAW
jgi:hypothetical protein